jgi:hypothetical protein
MKTNLPYWFEHFLVAVLITLPLLFVPKLALVSAGFMFYLGREIRDLEKLHYWDMRGFDWKGLAGPLFLMILLLIFW